MKLLVMQFSTFSSVTALIEALTVHQERLMRDSGARKLRVTSVAQCTEMRVRFKWFWLEHTYRTARS